MRHPPGSPFKRDAEVFCDGFSAQDARGGTIEHERYTGRRFCFVCGRRARTKTTERVDLQVGPWIDDYLFPDAWGQP